MLQLCCNGTCAESDPVTPDYDACYRVSMQGGGATQLWSANSVETCCASSARSYHWV